LVGLQKEKDLQSKRLKAVCGHKFTILE